MRRKMTITIDAEIYEGLLRTAGQRDLNLVIENLLRPLVLDRTLDDGYRAMAADDDREAEAQEWCEGLSADLANEAR
ncbi:hypothetical protein [Jiella marina]|uniref:hypothetical protein n=1 Tax=Jiella sp. LLJ827 TaxID=2917712 RepID=UPI0021017563|nr:hypothetical protein [Jiella sp. LLJ827]MCQ0989190.1 hypothetical protein [Jiella sp. LLJ827]